MDWVASIEPVVYCTDKFDEKDIIEIYCRIRGLYFEDFYRRQLRFKEERLKIERLNSLTNKVQYGLNENLIKVHIFREENMFCDCVYCENFKKLELKREQKL